MEESVVATVSSAILRLAIFSNFLNILSVFELNLLFISCDLYIPGEIAFYAFQKLCGS